ncbi:hypothetical protein E2542_SST10507 [Spatholobus suberectus]|nr:hypothetical protein E2542_SST10507 [Spatholobus suberectus]
MALKLSLLMNRTLHASALKTFNRASPSPSSTFSNHHSHLRLLINATIPSNSRLAAARRRHIDESDNKDRASEGVKRRKMKRR